MPLLNATPFRTAPSLSWTLSGPPTYDSISWSPAVASFASGFNFSQVGDRAYVTDLGTQVVYQYTTTGFAISPAPTGAGTSASLANPGGGFGAGTMDPYCVEFRTDGTRMFVGADYFGNGSAWIHEWTLAIAWDVTSTLTYVGSYQIPGAFEGQFGFHIKPDGTKMMVATTATGPASSNARLLEIGLGTTWSIAGVNTVNNTQVVSGIDIVCNDVRVDPSGFKIFWTGAATSTMYEDSMGTAWDLSTYSTSPANSLNTSAQTSPSGMVWKHDDGTKTYVNGGGTLYQYSI